MDDQKEIIQLRTRQLNDELASFINFFQQDLDYYRMIYAEWNAKDILGHITFWLESFARNISDLGKGLKPHPLKGKLSEVNKLSVEQNKNTPIPALITRLEKAYHTIEEFIFMESIQLIPYKKGSRDYSRIEYLEVVTHHIHKHLNDLKKNYA